MNLTLDDIQKALENWPKPGDWRARAIRIAEWSGATAWEVGFARNIATRDRPLTEKQEHKLMTIWRQYVRATPVRSLSDPEE